MIKGVVILLLLSSCATKTSKAIRGVLLGHYPQFQKCYQESLDKASKPFSKVLLLNFVIDTYGQVSSAAVKKTRGTIPPELEQCIVKVLKVMNFPELKNSRALEINQPMSFQSSKN